jgi:hypothetical protein
MPGQHRYASAELRDDEQEDADRQAGRHVCRIVDVEKSSAEGDGGDQQHGSEDGLEVLAHP